MTLSAKVEGIPPAWAEYVWFAKGARSRLYPIVVEFFLTIDVCAANAAPSLRAAHERRVRALQRRLLRLRLQRLCCALGRRPAKEGIYKREVRAMRRVLRKAKGSLGVESMDRGGLSLAMERLGSDKGSGRHNYTLFYQALFREGRDRVARVFELGIGSNNPDVPSNMGVDGSPGASLRGWREYFTNAGIFGGDVDEGTLFEEDRITTAFVDQMDPDSINRVFERFGDEFDLILDDGRHELSANRTFFEHAFGRLRVGGVFVIEDVAVAIRDSYKAFLRDYDAAILEIPHPWNCEDNCLALAVRH